jgi:hypothetical protein
MVIIERIRMSSPEGRGPTKRASDAKAQRRLNNRKAHRDSRKKELEGLKDGKVQTREKGIRSMVDAARDAILETRALIRDIDKNYTHGASVLFDKYGQLLELELETAVCEGGEILNEGTRLMDCYHTAKEHIDSRHFLLKLAPQIRPDTEVSEAEEDLLMRSARILAGTETLQSDQPAPMITLEVVGG